MCAFHDCCARASVVAAALKYKSAFRGLTEIHGLVYMIEPHRRRSLLSKHVGVAPRSRQPGMWFCTAEYRSSSQACTR